MSWGDSFKRAAEGGSDYDPPNGRYQVKIIDAGAFQARSGAQKEWCKVKLQILQGPEMGHQFEDFGPAGDHGGVGFDRMVERLLAYGLDLSAINSESDIEDLNAAMEDQLIGRTADIGVSHGGDRGQFLNINVHGSRTVDRDIPTTTDTPENGAPVEKPADAFAKAAGAKTPATTEDDDIPF